METKNLIIRKFEEKDLSDFIDLIKDKMASPLSIYDDQFPTDENDLENILYYFISSDDFLAVELKENQKVMGFGALNIIDENSRNIGYTIHSKYQNHRYGTELVLELVRYAKEDLMIKKLVSGTALINEYSVRLLEKAGFKKVREETCSFTADTGGNKIEFLSGLFELVLNE